MQADIDKCQQNGGNMVKAIVGANWGDEGKGKITDMLAEESDIIVRFQGGSNAGHTIIIIQQVLLATALLLIFHTLSRN